jgi:ganglioside GM2 activator
MFNLHSKLVSLPTVHFLKSLINLSEKAAVRVQKKIGFIWIDIPCIDNIGSCDYEDLCALIPFKPVGEPCPEPFLSLKLPCACPFSQVFSAVTFIS